MATLKAWDAINGALGTCYATINGNKEEMLYVKKVEATVKKNKSEIKVLGQTGVKHKSNGWSGSGSMTIYYSTTKFRNLMLDYIKNGKDAYFELIIQNSDPASEIGTQTIALKQVNIDNVTMAKLDINSTELDEEVSFTFNDIDILNSFNTIVGEQGWIMSKLQQMLNLNLPECITHSVAISKRFTDETGDILKFTIKPITYTNLNELKKRATYFD